MVLCPDGITQVDAVRIRRVSDSATRLASASDDRTSE
jgi:hypothetical protein